MNSRNGVNGINSIYAIYGVASHHLFDFIVNFAYSHK